LFSSQKCYQHEVGYQKFDFGYWKTHRLSTKTVRNKKGGSLTGTWNEVCPYDFLSSVDNMVCADGTCSTYLENVDYYLIPSLTWGQTLDTPPKKGEACLIAARQLIAAELNAQCNGACIPDSVQLAIDGAKAIMETECIDMYVDKTGPHNGLSSELEFNSSEVNARRELLGFAEVLDAYNNGYQSGPGHCGDSDFFPAVAEASCDGEAASASASAKSSSNGWSIAAVFLLIILVVWKVFACFVSFVSGNNYNGLPEDKFLKSVVVSSAPMEGNRRPHAGNISDY
jgi:hypothetical protein